MRNFPVRRLTIALAVCLLGASHAVAQPSALVDGNPGTTERLDADSGVDVALAVSRARFGEESASYVVLATNAVFADALAASPLAAGGPLLLTDPTILPAPVAAEIDRLLPTGGEVIILGGPAAVADSIAERLSAGGHAVIRLAGPDRIGTAVAVAEFAATRIGSGTVVAVARAYGPGSAAWADSVTGGAWAANTGTPVVVTPTDSVDPRVSDLLARLGTTTTIILGGPAAVGDTVTATLPDPRRVAGEDRAATAGAIADVLMPASTTSLVVNAYADDGWAAGLAAAGLAADLDSPLLVANDSTVPAATIARTSGPCGQGPGRETLLIGGRSLLSDAVAHAIDAADGAACPPPPRNPLVLDFNSLGADVPVGMAMDGARARVAEDFPQTDDSGWIQDYCGPLTPQGSPAERYVTYANELTLSFSNPSNPTLKAYWIGSEDGSSVTGLITAAGLGLGATGRQITATYPDAEDFFTGFGTDYVVRRGGGSLRFTIRKETPEQGAIFLAGGQFGSCE